MKNQFFYQEVYRIENNKYKINCIIGHTENTRLNITENVLVLVATRPYLLISLLH